MITSPSVAPVQSHAEYERLIVRAKQVLSLIHI